ncbi:hypothetical protein P9112_002222 [Eukaryota sp. TZLM1-RC]
MSVDPCNASNERLANSEIQNPLSNAENFEIIKYNEPSSKFSGQQHAKYNLCSFVSSIWFTCSNGYTFFAELEMIVKSRINRNFNRLVWQNRIVCSIFKQMLKMVSDAFLSLGSHYKRVAPGVFFWERWII